MEKKQNFWCKKQKVWCKKSNDFGVKQIGVKKATILV